MNSEQKHTTETQRTQRFAQRSLRTSTFEAKPLSVECGRPSAASVYLASVKDYFNTEVADDHRGVLIRPHPRQFHSPNRRFLLGLGPTPRFPNTQVPL